MTMQFKHLSKQDAFAILEIINQSLSCTTTKQVVDLMSRLGTLINYKSALACLGQLGPDGNIENLSIFNIDYPAAYLEVLAEQDLISADPVVNHNFRHFNLQYWQDTLQQSILTDKTHKLISLAEDFGYSRVSQGVGYAHGIRNHKGTEGSLFCYHELERSPRSEEILQLVIPHFHTSLCRVAGDLTIHSPLTSRETEIIKWIKAGKSTWDISEIIGISQRTVKFHVSNIMTKLNASTRIHAVAIAMEHGYISVD